MIRFSIILWDTGKTLINDEKQKKFSVSCYQDKKKIGFNIEKYGFKLEQAMSYFIQKLMLKKRWTGEEAVGGIVDLTSFRLKVIMLANYVYSDKHNILSGQ